ncbi:hypothetical protein HGRIS_010421 [Hohenbuehelia grisea]|uniref:Uncharacterized protein n=1 Tax=Hohenbuehelia grisea TaxID=104357 RepID=A0ABR3IZF3_9AGAR
MTGVENPRTVSPGHPSSHPTETPHFDTFRAENFQPNYYQHGYGSVNPERVCINAPQPFKHCSDLLWTCLFQEPLSTKALRGSHNKVHRFIKHLEALFAQNNVTQSQDKCESITQYCSSNECSFIEALLPIRARLDRTQDDLADSMMPTWPSSAISCETFWKKYCRQFIRMEDSYFHMARSHRTNTPPTSGKAFPGPLAYSRAEDSRRETLAETCPSLSRWKLSAKCEAYFQRDKFLSIVIDSDSSGEDSEDSANKRNLG